LGHEGKRSGEDHFHECDFQGVHGFVLVYVGPSGGGDLISRGLLRGQQFDL
jgi:hypothetical protein